MTTETLLKITSNVDYMIGLLAWLTDQRGRRGCCASVGHVVGVLDEWRGWHSKVSSIGDIGGNTRVRS